VRKALRKPGISGENLLSFLERRLDNIVYRAGFAPTLLAARQLVLHGHILVNRRKVNRPSYLLGEGDVVSIKEKSKKMSLVEEGLVKSRARPELPYLQVDKTNLTGTLTSVPERTQIPLEINEAIIMEHYSRYI
jgi:small subunit ribosomal protein S4